MVASPATLVTMGAIGLPQILALVGLVLAAVLQRRRVPGAFLVSILTVTALGLAWGLVTPPASWASSPDFRSVFLKLDPVGALSPVYLSAMVAILFTDLFDSISTFVGVAQATDLLENGEAKNLRQGLIVDAWATLTAGLFGTSSGTAYIESVAGIEAGGRTGRASVVTAFCFLPFLFLAPLAALVPAFATAPILILVGSSMFRAARELRFDSLEEWLPAFLTIALIPLTFSITQGILWGFLSHVVLFALVGRRRELSPMLLTIAAVSAGMLWLERGN